MAVPSSASQQDTRPSRPRKTLAEPGWDEALPSSLGRKYKRGSGRHFLTTVNSQMDRLRFLRVNFLLRLYMGTEMREQSTPASCQ